MGIRAMGAEGADREARVSGPLAPPVQEDLSRLVVHRRGPSEVAIARSGPRSVWARRSRPFGRPTHSQ